MVKNFSFDLINNLRNKHPLKYEWKIPNWVTQNKDLILSKIESDETICRYTEFHDVGKPFCLKIDENGNQHFPNHSKISAEIYKKLICKNDPIVFKLIENDMDIHLLSAEGVVEFSERPECVTSLIVGLAELHANSTMFGGIESISFKIKWKHINKRGRQILDILSKNKK